MLDQWLALYTLREYQLKCDSKLKPKLLLFGVAKSCSDEEKALLIKMLGLTEQEVNFEETSDDAPRLD